MCVPVCICMCVRVYACVHVDLCLHVCMWICGSACVCMCVHLCMCVYLHISMCEHVCICACVCICVCIWCVRVCMYIRVKRGEGRWCGRMLGEGYQQRKTWWTSLKDARGTAEAGVSNSLRCVCATDSKLCMWHSDTLKKEEEWRERLGGCWFNWKAAEGWAERAEEPPCLCTMAMVEGCI